MEMRLRFGVFIDYLVFLLVQLLEQVLNLLPRKAVFAFGRFIGRIVWGAVCRSPCRDPGESDRGLWSGAFSRVDRQYGPQEF